jgi:hypothetical protein
VGVDRQPREPEGDAPHDVGGLLADAWKALEVHERRGDLATEPLAEKS